MPQGVGAKALERVVLAVAAHAIVVCLEQTCPPRGTLQRARCWRSTKERLCWTGTHAKKNRKSNINAGKTAKFIIRWF